MLQNSNNWFHLYLYIQNQFFNLLIFPNWSLIWLELIEVKIGDSSGKVETNWQTPMVYLQLSLPSCNHCDVTSATRISQPFEFHWHRHRTMPMPRAAPKDATKASESKAGAREIGFSAIAVAVALFDQKSSIFRNQLRNCCKFWKGNGLIGRPHCQFKSIQQQLQISSIAVKIWRRRRRRRRRRWWGADAFEKLNLIAEFSLWNGGSNNLQNPPTYSAGRLYDRHNY